MWMFIALTEWLLEQIENLESQVCVFPFCSVLLLTSYLDGDS